MCSYQWLWKAEQLNEHVEPLNLLNILREYHSEYFNANFLNDQSKHLKQCTLKILHYMLTKSCLKFLIFSDPPGPPDYTPEERKQ